MTSRHASLTACLICAATLAAAPGPAAALETLSFRTPGASDALRAELRAASLLISAEAEGMTEPLDLLAAARAEYSRLLGTLYAGGRYGATISVRIDGQEAADIPPLARITKIDEIVVSVDPGPLYRFSRANVAPIAPGTPVPEAFRAGEYAFSGAIRDAALVAIDSWRSAGHAKAGVANQRVVAEHPARNIAVDLDIDPGPRLVFGELRVRGARRVDEARIRHLMEFPSGRRFDPAEIEEGVTRLRRTGTFRSVSATEASTPNADGTLDVTLSVAEERRRRYGVGLEYSTVDGLSATAFWMHRNFFGGMERFRVEGEWSGIDGNTGGMDYRIGARLGRPGHRGPDTDLYVVGELEQLNEPDFISHSVSGAIGYTRIASDRLKVSAGAGFRFSSVKEDGVTREFQFLTLPLSADWDDRDDSLNPTDGIFATGTFMPFLGVNGSASGARFVGDARTYRGFGSEERPVVLAGRVQVGSILEAPLTGVPNDLRFYSGGGGTVRGQDYQSLGVVVDGDKTGGRSFLGLSAEARVGITDAISVVGFADWGYVGEDSFPGGTGDSHAGAGVGLRYNTGIGPIRLDVATPLGDDAGSDIFLYIGIGQAF